MKTRFFVARCALSLLAAAAPAFAGAAGAAPHWGYAGHEGPQHWDELNKEYSACKLGREQSPINISAAVKADLPAIHFAYRPSGLRIVNNGHTIQVNYNKGSAIHVGDKRYDLVQFHFHTPSEERINGKGYDMVWHLVHKDDAGKLGVVAVLVKEGKANDVIGAVAANLPGEPNQEQEAKGVTVNAARLLPATRGYYHFMGSLTTPPCSEGVSWYVLKEPIEASKEQIARFKTLFGHNARPLQPRNARAVKESK